MTEAWFNWARGELAILRQLPQTDDEVWEYIPPTQAALARYEHYRAIGLTPASAAVQVVADLADSEVRSEV